MGEGGASALYCVVFWVTSLHRQSEQPKRKDTTIPGSFLSSVNPDENENTRGPLAGFALSTRQTATGIMTQGKVRGFCKGVRGDSCDSF